MSKVIFIGYYPDFSIYYDAAKFYLSGGNPYLGDSSFFSPFIYPPIVILFFIPFAFIPQDASSVIWIIGSILILFISLYLLSKIYGLKPFSKTGLIFFSLVFIFFPVKYSLGMGQINLIVLSLMVLALWNLKKEHEFRSGFWWGAGLLLKIFPIFVPIYFLITGKGKILLGMLVIACLTTIITLIFVPVDIIATFFQKVLPSFGESWRMEYYSQSLGAFLGKNLGTGIISTYLKNILSMVLISASFIAVVKNRKNDYYHTSLKIGILITLSLILNSYAWQHHFVWLIIPFYATFFYLRKFEYSKTYYILLATSYFLVSINFKDPNILPVLIQSHVFFGALMLLLLDIKVLLKAKS